MKIAIPHSVFRNLCGSLSLMLCMMLIQQPLQAADIESIVADFKSIALRVQVLEDREEIRALIIAYGRTHDARDYIAFSELFAKETGEWVGGFGSAKGSQAIFELMDKLIGHNPQPGGSGTYHVLSNEQIDVEGDLASAVTKWIYVTRNDEGNPGWVFLGHYDDNFIRENGRWRFLRREAFTDIPAQE